MTKVLVENEEEETRVPFLRGILVHSLQNAGLAFEPARSIANKIRSDIENLSSITAEALKQRVIDELDGSEYSEYLPAYQQEGTPFVIQVRARDGSVTEFSRQEYRNRLEAIGLRPGDALPIVHKVTDHLARRQTSEIDSKTIARITYRLLRRSKELGPAVARRWLIWQDFLHSDRPLLLLIGGTAGSGKSTIASDLASRLNIVRTQSTDMLREVMRSMTDRELDSLLHASSFNAWKELPADMIGEFTDPDELVLEGYRAQADLMSTAIDTVIQRAERERVSLIMEGVHLRPTHLERLLDSEQMVAVPLVLAVLKRKTLVQRISGRSVHAPGRRASHYTKYIDDIWKLQSSMLSEADAKGIPIVINDERERVLREVMLTVIETLSLSFNKSAEEVFA